MAERTLAECSLSGMQHGTYVSYTNHRCRCVECRAANRAYKRQWESRRPRPTLCSDSLLHGTVNGYKHYGCRCSPCVDAKRAENRAAYRRDPAKKRAVNDAWLDANRERYAAHVAEKYAARREEEQAKRREHYRQNPDSYKGRARARQLQVRGVEVETISRDAVWLRDGGACHICQLPADPDNWHLDHVQPLKLDGTHTFDNVAVSHPRCNREKGAKPWPSGR